MELIEDAAQALWGDPVFRPIGWEVGVKAAIRAVLDGVEPVAFLFEHKEVGVEFSFDPLEQIGMTEGWTETPLYSLEALKEAMDHD